MMNLQTNLWRISSKDGKENNGRFSGSKLRLKVQTFALEIGLEKQMSKFILINALQHLSACMAPVSVNMDKSELP